MCARVFPSVCVATLWLQEADHPLFKRQGCDLVMKREITLREALCGARFTVNGLDGKQFLVEVPPGEVRARVCV